MKLFLLHCLKIYQIIFFMSGTLCGMEENNSFIVSACGIDMQEGIISLAKDTIQAQETTENKSEIIDKNILKVIVKDGKEFFIEREILELSPIVKNLIEDTKTQEVFIPGADGYTFAMLYELLKMVHGQVKEQEAGQLECEDYIKWFLDEAFVHETLYNYLNPIANKKTLKKIDKGVFLSHFLELPCITKRMIRLYVDQYWVINKDLIEYELNGAYGSIIRRLERNQLTPVEKKNDEERKAYFDKLKPLLIETLAEEVIKNFSKEISIAKDLLSVYQAQIRRTLVNLVRFSSKTIEIPKIIDFLHSETIRDYSFLALFRRET